MTGGANQAFALLALALCDPGDRAVLFAPYYFSHLVALQIAQAEVVKGRWDPATWLPDVEVGREGGREGEGEGGREGGRDGGKRRRRSAFRYEERDVKKRSDTFSDNIICLRLPNVRAPGCFAVRMYE